jgi:hypothetical protein
MLVKRIIDLVLEKKAQILNDKKAAEANSLLAIAAIQAGISSTAWKTYMQQYVDNNNADQLARLMATDGTLDDTPENREVRMHRAYLVGNAVCATGTTPGFDFGVEGIDDGIV